ncbi:hypothetical protein SUGI_0738980 [Cryptomeria japonica]|uniref:protein HHL1, chloroplastic n=1 Tax=Cryptomeria japonica TaxID=3369 RepID=UPI002414969F|nr:protein HHL1, chloroplastic [Cryptomeria japonica]GLJ36717.1 hypothetical protein SUGI_0738980 [Cryptomeria japonica]
MEKGIALNAARSSPALSFCKWPKLKLASQDANFFRGSQLMGVGKRVNLKSWSTSRSKYRVVEAKGGKGRRGMGMGTGRTYQRPAGPIISKAPDDNPRFLVFVRTLKVPRWYPLSIITGGTTAKIMVAAKDTFIGKYIYESTLTRNIGTVVYNDEEKIKNAVLTQYPMLKAASGFLYGYKLIDPVNPDSSIYPSNVTMIPPKEELKPVVEKVKDYFGNAISGVKESFGNISNLKMGAEENEATPKKEEKSEAGRTS